MKHENLEKCDEKLLELFSNLGQAAKNIKDFERQCDIVMCMLEIYKTVFGLR